MRKYKGLLALGMAAVLAAAVQFPAAAAVVQVVNSSNYVAARSFRAYQVFRADWEGGRLTNGTAGAGIDWDSVDWEAIQAIDADFSEVASPAELLAALDQKDTQTGEKVAKILKNAVSADAAVTVTDGGTLADGYYIILDETVLGENDVANAALLQVAGDKVTIRVKTDKPSVQKKIDGDLDADTGTSGLVDANNGQVNDLVPYVITAVVPDTSYYDNYYMEFADSLSAGLDISEASGEEAFSDYRVYLGDAALSSDRYTLTADPDRRSVRVAFTNMKGEDGKTLKLTYKARINDSAVVGSSGNPNEVSLKYTNSPDHSGAGEYDSGDYVSETPKDVVVTYLTGIAVYKVDGEDESPLEGAVFQIEGTRAVSSRVAGVVFEEDDEGSYYRLAGGGYTTTAPTEGTAARYDQAVYGKKYSRRTVDTVQTETEEVKVSAVSGADGIIRFGELGAGTYTITELRAPDGYNRLTAPVVVNIAFSAPDPVADGTEACSWTNTVVSGAAGEDVVYNEQDGLFHITVENQSGALLPATGGTGTRMFYLIGAVLVTGAGVLLVTRRRMRA